MSLRSIALKAARAVTPRISEPSSALAASCSRPSPSLSTRRFSTGHVSQEHATTATAPAPVAPAVTLTPAKIKPESKKSPLKPLPPLPQASSYPCPVITQDELIQYLVPLYERQWRVVILNHVAGLQRKVRLLKYKDVLEFVNELSQYAISEIVRSLHLLSRTRPTAHDQAHSVCSTTLTSHSATARS